MRAEILLAAASPPSSRRVDTEGMQEERRATDALIKHYREVKRHGRMHDIDIRVRLFCEDLKARNGGKLPSPKGGRPAEEHEHFRIAFWINERLAELGSARGNVEIALREAMGRFYLGYEAVRGIYYAACKAKDWQREVAAQRGLQELLKG